MTIVKPEVLEKEQGGWIDGWSQLFPPDPQVERSSSTTNGCFCYITLFMHVACVS